MATLALHPNLPSGAMGGGGGSGGSSGPFSPLTLFECTITNATMLVDSMPVRDLLAAFRIVSQLGAHVAEVLDPQVGRLADTAEDHAARCGSRQRRRRRPSPTTAVDASAAAGIQHHRRQRGAADAAAAAAPSLKRELCSEDDDEEPEYEEDDDNNGDDDARRNSVGGLFPPVAAAASSFVGDDFTGYCGGGDDSLTAVPIASASSSGAAAAAPSSAKLARRGSVDVSASETGELSAEWKGILRKSYRQLKEETGSNVFDFALPYSARVNLDAANRVIDRARRMMPDCQPADNVHAWTRFANYYLSIYYNKTLKANFWRRKKSFSIGVLFKLNRRQKAYESLREQLEPPLRERYERVLNRDFTSSDDEAPGGGGDSDGGAGAGDTARVRQLPWESGELAEMKRSLDQLYYDRLADARQRAEMDRLRRLPGYASGRAPPADCPAWARLPAPAPAAAAAATDEEDD